MSYSFGIELARFQFAMAEKLQLPKNQAKAHWSELSIPAIRRRLNDELKELDEAIMNNESTEAVISECVDVANFAMFLADRYAQN